MYLSKVSHKHGVTTESLTDPGIAVFIKKAYNFLIDYVPFDEEKIFVAGGVFARLYHDLPIRDIDVYIAEDGSFGDTVEQLKDVGFGVKYESNYHTKYAKFKTNEGYEIDVVNFHKPKNVSFVSTFDFSASSFAIDENFFYVNKECWDTMKEKKFFYNRYAHLAFNKDNNAFTRFYKYIKLGFEPDLPSFNRLLAKLIESSPESVINWNYK